MKYTIAFAAAIAAAYAGDMSPIVYGAAVSSAVVTSAPAATDAPKTSTAFVTDEVTILSCGPEVTNCPLRSHTKTHEHTHEHTHTHKPETPTQAPPAPPKTSEAPPPAQTTPAATSHAVVPPPPMISTEAITTCVPTTIYHTITITQTTPAAVTKAPYATGNPGPYVSGAASGTGVPIQPASSTPTIVAANGAAGLSASFGGLALAAAAAVLFA